jgi:LuxR family transcriptional regulator, maltose regulon positive regulatory protein
MGQLRRLDQLLHTKLMPPHPHRSVIPRADLLARLDAGLTKKLTLINAPTGFGKTTLASLWIDKHIFASAWVTLDGNDNDPTRFWTYVVSGLRNLEVGLGKATLSLLAAPQPASFQTLLSPFLNDMAKANAECVLVLDDYQAITSDEINAGLGFLIQHLPETFHLLLLTRSDPALPLGILRARGELLELSGTDLQFSLAETQAFLHTALPTEMPLHLAAQLQERTQGWPAGLRLAAISLQDKDSADAEKIIQTFSGGHRFVADYLTNEVFAHQPQTVQDFLLKTCFLSRLTASLCDALTGTDTGAASLAQLERANLFIVRLEHAGDRTWYRYNPLFAESIQFLARQRFDETALNTLFEKASHWYEYHGYYDEAIESALAGKLYASAMPLIEKFVEMRALSEMQTVSRWLADIPQEVILLHPGLSFTFAQIILYSNDRFAPATAARLEPYLRVAESLWCSPEKAARLGQLLSFRGTLIWWQADLQKACEYARQSLELLPESDVLWRGNSLLIVSQAALEAGHVQAAQDTAMEARALSGAAQNNYSVLAATQILGEVFYWLGELEQAELLNRQILVEAVGDESMLDDQGIASLNLARIAYERNELEQAQQAAARALELGEQRLNEMLRVQAAIQLAQICAAHNDLPRAQALLQSQLAHIHNPASMHELQNAQVHLSIRAHSIASLDWWLKLIFAGEQQILPMQKERQDFTLARLRIAEGRMEAALALLEPWQKDSSANGRVRSQVEALCLEALTLQEHSSRAAATLNQALSLGQAHGFRRIFLDEGAPMAGLLQASLSKPANRTLGVYAATLLRSFPPDAQINRKDTSSTLGMEALSQQELRVLRLLVAGLSNPAIAQELVVSTNTIKTQVKSIYHKLNVNSRAQARDLARELKLLD